MGDPFSYRSLGPRQPESSSISQQLFSYVDDNFIPLEVTLEITRACNLTCAHCYNCDRRIENHPSEPSLSREALLRIIGEVYDAGSLSLTFTGGEPLLHPDLFEAAAAARNRHMAVYLKTNGTMLYDNNIKRLIESRIMGIEVSMYGADEKTHDEMTGIQGSFIKSVSGVFAASSAGIPCKFIFILTNRNFKETVEMQVLAANAGAEFGFNPQIHSRYDSSVSPLDFRMNREQLLESYSGPLRKFLSAPDHNPGSSVQCGCARGVCGISASGEVYPCISAPISAGNIHETSFDVIWKHAPELERIRSLKLKDFDKCLPCPDRPWCRRSSGFVYLNTGNYTGAEEWTCMEAGVIRQALRRPSQ